MPEPLSPPNFEPLPDRKPEKRRKSMWVDEPQVISATEWNAHLIYITAGEDIKEGSPVYIGADGKAYPIDPNYKEE